MKTINVLGSTGTIGRKALAVLKPSVHKLNIISCNRNYKLFIEQLEEHNPNYGIVLDDEALEKTRASYKGKSAILSKGEFLDAIRSEVVDISVIAISGMAAIEPSFEAAKFSKRLAMANKETIVSCGKRFMDHVAQCGCELIPIDSEHSSLFRLLKGRNRSGIARIYITASGGAFRDYEEHELANVSVEDALKHPNWTMGPKITVDSATLMNKCFEIIEAAYLFDIEIEKITPILHNESKIHAIIEYVDGSAELSASHPDMIVPINYAINYPDISLALAPRLNLTESFSLTFSKFKDWQSRNLEMAYKAFREKKTMRLNSANDEAVELFLNGKIKFTDIAKIVRDQISS